MTATLQDRPGNLTWDTLRSPWEIAADLVDPPAGRWAPEEHQVPPPGRWYGWLLMGGRGTGKTDASAHYFYDHCMGPPCDPNVPGGHWPAIIAPTLGDAVTSCVNGPSGLRSINPLIKTRVTPGGTLAQFPNGVEAKLFGASTPEDVERLRSGGNRCMTADTPVEIMRDGIAMTARIDQVTTSDLALTRQGYLPIDRAGMISESEPIWTIELSDGTTVRCTADHQWPTEGGKLRTDQLAPGAILATWTSQQESTTSRFHVAKTWSSMASPSRNGLMEDTEKPEAPSAGWLDTSGSVNTDQSRRVMRSTIAMRILATIASGTSNASASRNTQGFMMRMAGRLKARWSALANIALVPSWPRSSSLIAALAMQDSAVSSVGTVAVRQSGRPGARRNTHVPLAAPSRGTRTTAPLAATTPQDRSTTESVRSAESRSQECGSVSVVRIVTPSTSEPVYCLRVPGPHEFVIHRHVVTSNCIAWLEELAAWRHLEDSFKHMRFGLRLGERPHWIASTTPKVRMLIKNLVRQAQEGKDDIGNHIVMTHGTTDDNPHLPQHIRDLLYAEYGGTRLGRQELEGLLLLDVQNALWNEDVIAKNRIPSNLCPPLQRILVAIDPAATENGNEHGIIVVGMIPRWDSPVANHVPGLEHLPHAFVLADESIPGNPTQWARKAKQAKEDWGANGYVAEVNNGGDLVKMNIRVTDPAGYVQDVWASRGKAKRAEPVSSVYEQNRVHHVGTFPFLEDQMCSFDPIDPDDSWSPDRMDAMVWGVSKLIVNTALTSNSKMKDKRLKGRR